MGHCQTVQIPKVPGILQRKKNLNPEVCALPTVQATFPNQTCTVFGIWKTGQVSRGEWGVETPRFLGGQAASIPEGLVSCELSEHFLQFLPSEPLPSSLSPLMKILTSSQDTEMKSGMLFHLSLVTCLA